MCLSSIITSEWFVLKAVLVALIRTKWLKYIYLFNYTFLKSWRWYRIVNNIIVGYYLLFTSYFYTPLGNFMNLFVNLCLLSYIPSVALFSDPLSPHYVILIVS